MSEHIEDTLRGVLKNILQLGVRADALTGDSLLLGYLPELDSMAVAALIGAIEDEFELEFDDDYLSAEDFETFGNLCDLVKRHSERGY